MKEQEIHEIIFRSLRAECTQEELVYLERWLKTSEEHSRLYEDIKKIARESELLRGMEMHDKTEALRKVMKRVNGFSRARWSVLKYAAIIMLPVLVGLWWYYNGGENRTEEAVMTAVGEPGRTKAILYLSDGRSVNLENIRDSVVVEDGGESSQVRLCLKQERELNYQEGIRSGNDEAMLHHRVEVPRGGEYMLVLADGTKVWLNSETKLEYPLAFGENERRVRLQGEAYFEVVKDNSRRFYVDMGAASVEVTGTSFNVSCYPDEGSCGAVLVEGSINFLANDRIVGVSVGERACMDLNSGTVVVEPVDLKYYTAWRYGKFYFYDTPLVDIVRKLRRWYNARFVFTDTALENIRFSGVALREKSLVSVLRLLESTNSVKFVVAEDNTVKVVAMTIPN